MNCSSNIVDQAFTKVPCLSDNKSNVYVYLGSADTNDAISDLPESCVFISKVPVVLNRSVDKPSYEDLRKLLDSGLDLTWSDEHLVCPITDCKLLLIFIYAFKCRGLVFVFQYCT